MKKGKNKKVRLVPITLEDGTNANIDANSLSGWAVHHGTTAKGVEVNSLNSKTIGKTVILRSGETGVPFSVSKDELEVAGTQIFKENSSS